MNKVHQNFSNQVLLSLRARFAELLTEKPYERRVHYALSLLDEYFLRLWGFWRIPKIDWSQLRENDLFCCVVVALEKIIELDIRESEKRKILALQEIVEQLGAHEKEDPEIGDLMAELASGLIDLNASFLGGQA